MPDPRQDEVGSDKGHDGAQETSEQQRPDILTHEREQDRDDNRDGRDRDLEYGEPLRVHALLDEVARRGLEAVDHEEQGRDA